MATPSNSGLADFKSQTKTGSGWPPLPNFPRYSTTRFGKVQHSSKPLFGGGPKRIQKSGGNLQRATRQLEGESIPLPRLLQK